MTVNTTDSKIQFLGDGSTTQFSFPFLALEKDDIGVLVTNTTDETVQGVSPGESELQVEGSDYTLSLADPGGTVDFGLSQAPASGLRVTIQRSTTALQQIDYVENDPFPADTHERGLDRSALRDQELSSLLQLALKFQPGDDQTINPFLPLKEARANKLLGFNGDGVPAALSKLPDTQTVTSFAETLLDDPSAADARATLGVTGLADIYGVTSGTATALTLSLPQGPSQEEGTLLVMEPHVNVGTGATLDYNGNGPRPLKLVDTVEGGGDNLREVDAGELAISKRYLLNFNQGLGHWEVVAGVAVGGLTKRSLPVLTQPNTYSTLQTVKTTGPSVFAGFAIDGDYSGAHKFSFLQKEAGSLTFRDGTTSRDWLKYDGTTDTVNVTARLEAGGNRVLTENENPWREISRFRISDFAPAAWFEVEFPSGFTFLRIWIVRWSMDVQDEPFARFLDSNGDLIPGTDGGGSPNYSTSTWNHKDGGNGSTGDRTKDRMYLMNWGGQDINPPGSTMDGHMDIANHDSTAGWTRIHGLFSSLEPGQTPLQPRQDMFTGCLRTDKFSPAEIGGIRIYAGTHNNATWQDGIVRVQGFVF